MQKINYIFKICFLATITMEYDSKIIHQCQQDTLDLSNIGLADPDPNHGKRKRALKEQEWEPFRVTFDYTGLNSMTGSLEKYKSFLRKQGAIAEKFFFDNLLVKRIAGNNKFPFSQEKCQEFKVSQADKTNGVSNSDFHVYFTYKNEMKGYLAWAAACVLDYHTQRPRFGQVNWNALFLGITDITENDSYEVFVEVTLHEITHALGFTNWLYFKWRDPRTGEPYKKENSQPTQTVTVNGEEMTYLTTPKIKEFAQKHFNCSSAKGMRVENNGGSGSAGSHWEKSLLENEFMTASVMTHDAIYSNFTFALLEDSGWYKPLYKNVDAADWGKNKGCDFLDNCDATKYREFVNNKEGQYCNFYHNSVASTNQYGDTFGENCQIPDSSSRQCIQIGGKSSIQAKYTGESYGDNSRCFNSTIRTVDKFPYPQEVYDDQLGQVRCLQYECDPLGGINVIINDQTYPIDRITNKIDIKINGSNQKIEGIVYGPEDWHGFCNTYPRPCKNFCSKNGYCMGNTCHCINGFAGEDCSIPCANTDYVQNGVCLNSMLCPQGYEVKPETKECIRIPNPCSNQIIYNGQCLDTCPTRTFQEENTCKSCQENCLSCLNQSFCQQCELSHFEHNNVCVSQCPIAYYGNRSNQMCEECPSGCKSCYSEKICSSCSYGGLLFVDIANRQIVCVQSCPESHYELKGQCVQCSEGCTSCKSKNKCQTCSQSYLLYINKQSQQQTCVTKCPFRTLFDQQKKQCILCSFSEVYYEGICRSNCPRGYFKNENSCSKCDDVCETCSSGGMCDSCIKGLILDFKIHSCVEKNTSCASGCSSCSSLNSCDNCDRNKVKFINQYQQGKCLDDCPDGYQNEGGICQKVISERNWSKKCGPGKYEFITRRGFSFCLSKCFRGSFPNSQGICQRK